METEESVALATREARGPTDLATQEWKNAGIMAIARQSDAEFKESKRLLKLGIERLDELIDTVMVEGVDVGVIPGTGQKKALLLPGAEKLSFMAKFVPEFVWVRTVGERDEKGAYTSPPVHYGVTCRLHLGNERGSVVAEGVGSCNAWESKYRWRRAGRDAPVKLENADPHDLDNTILKMAKKRAFVDAIKTATMGSGRLVQDMEDQVRSRGQKAAPRPKAAPPEAEEPPVEDGAPAPDELHPGGAILTLRDRVLSAARRMGYSKVADILIDLERASGRTHEDLNQLTETDCQVLLEWWAKGSGEWRK